MRLKIRTKIILSFFAPIIPLTVIVVIVSAYTLNNLYNEAQALDSISKEKIKVADLRLSLAMVLMPVNDYIITGDKKYPDDFKGISKEIEERLKEIEGIARISEEKEILKDVKAAWQNIRQISSKIFAIPEPSGNKDAARLMEEMDYKWGYPAIERLKRWREIDLKEYKDALEKHNMAWRQAWLAMIISVILFLVICLIYIIFYSKAAARNEESLRVSEGRCRCLVEASPDMMFRLSRDGIFLDFKPAKGFEPYIPPEQFLGKRISDALPPEVSVPAISYIEKAFQTKKEQVFEYKLPIKGELLDYEARLNVISEKEIIVMVRDLTEIKRLEQEMIRQEKLAGMGHLAAGVAHELKNPLNIIYGNAQILEMEENDPEKKKIYKTVFQQIERSTKIINNLLDFARKREHEIKDIDINTLLEKTIMLVEYEMRTENIVFVRNFDKGLPHIKGDSDHFAQVFLNLINNARDSMNEKQIKIMRGEIKAKDWKGEVRITTKKTNDSIEIIFEDTGLGIPEEKIENIFKPFFTTKGEGKGTGLGLSIAKNLIESHGGKIELENRVGEGVRFIIYLPL